MSLSHFVQVENLYIRIMHHIKNRGLISFLFTSLRKINEVIVPPRANSFTLLKPLIAAKEGLEIGGSSKVFSKSGLMPIYEIAGRVDNCNFGQTTIWEGVLKEGENFRYGRGPILGNQYIREATNLDGILSNKYDFICSAYMIQHCANPLKALYEWIRVLKNDGIMVLFIPHKGKTFDHKRPVTLLEHLIEDYARGTTEDDTSHIDEVLKLHDLTLDPLAGSYEEFRQRTLNNPEKRAVHQHVFDTDLVIRMLDYVGLQICNVEVLRPDNIIVISRKLTKPQKVDNSFFRNGNSSYRF